MVAHTLRDWLPSPLIHTIHRAIQLIVMLLSALTFIAAVAVAVYFSWIVCIFSLVGLRWIIQALAR